MNRYCQEKHEVRSEPNRNDELGGWASDRSARTKKGTPGREGRPGGDRESKSMNNAVLYNSLPGGSDITDQEMADIRRQELSRGGLGNGDQYTTDVTTESLRTGFARKNLSPTDDFRKGEGQNGFYEDITVGDVTGYVERGNVLDRY
jgi:hypothetical protein